MRGLGSAAGEDSDVPELELDSKIYELRSTPDRKYVEHAQDEEKRPKLFHLKKLLYIHTSHVNRVNDKPNLQAASLRILSMGKVPGGQTG